MKAFYGIAILVCCLGLTACANQPPQQQSVAAYVSQQKTAARKAEQEGRLAEAVSLWQSLLPLELDDADIHLALSSLEQRIAKRVKRGLRNAEAAYAKGNDSAGDLWLLKVLALKPGQPQALSTLQQSTSSRAQAQQAAKSDEESERLMARRRAAPDSAYTQMRRLYDQGDYQAVLSLASQHSQTADVEIGRLLALTHIALADKAQKQAKQTTELEHVQAAIKILPTEDETLLNRRAALRKSLSEVWYRKGIGMMQEDLPVAISALEKSVDYNPDNRAAKLQLNKARILKRNLEKIKNR